MPLAGNRNSTKVAPKLVPAKPAKSVIDAKARALMLKANKELGPGSAVIGTEVPPISRFTTGSLALDVILQGGWPANKWSEIVGEESSGKTAVAFKTVAANMKRDPRFVAVWIASEPFVAQYAEMCGVDLSRLIVIDTVDQETAYQLAIDYADSRSVDCIVIDSLPALVSMAEDEKDMEGFSPGRGAQLTGQFFRKVGKATKRSLTEEERPVFGLLINQYRHQIGVQHGDPRTTPGGKGKNFAYFVRAEVSRADWIEQGKGKAKRRVGQQLKIRLIKNKSGQGEPLATVDFYNRDGAVIPAGEYDYGKEVVSLALLRGIIKTTSSGRYSYDFNGQERKWHGAAAVVQSIREEVDLAAQIDREVRDTIGHIYDDTEAPDGDDD